ncbi:MAG: hypothetical protein E7562_07620 [Ruminococcaceae bacterium]|nr:hypothetical protein [Oscillospiraceae bacterium]
MKKVVFLKNAAILTATSIILRLVGILFKVWLASAVGAEGIGLYQLIFSVYMLVSTFASAGIVTAVTRLIADELALGSKCGIQKILNRSIWLTLIIAFISMSITYFGADFISINLLAEKRAIPAIKMLSFALPFIGIVSVLRGYFIARRKAAPSAFSQLLEQAARIIIIVLMLKKYLSYGLSAACAAVLFADAAAHAISLLFLWILYIKDIGKLKFLKGRKSPPFSVLRAVLHIGAPITAGRYLNTALRTAENLLVPRGLEKSGAGKAALSQFGMIKGMALPVLFFPSSLLSSLSTMLIPEISEAKALNKDNLVKLATGRIIQLTSIIAFLFSGVFLTAGKQIGTLIYGSDDVGFLLCALSPIVPLMYLDSVCDGILKGLDQQKFCFKNSILDSVLRILLVISFLPKTGMSGFLGIMYISNILTCLLNVGRLIKVSKTKINVVLWFFIPFSTALCIMLPLSKILMLLNFSELVYIILLCIISFPLYFLVLFFFKSFSKDDILDVLRK